MKLSECKYGVLVETVFGVVGRNSYTRVGMVVGVTQNSLEEAIPLIHFQNGEEYGVHPANLFLYEE
tara:strand:- start:99 stop:296 length:198 start_codon:yes stop_codon:yes gene_type:complete